MVKNQNFSNVDVSSLPDEFEFEGCNFSRPQPVLGPPVTGVRLWPGDDRPRTFRNCNLTNCEPPPGSTIIKCNTFIIEKQIPAFSDTLVIDGVTEDTQQYHDYTIHGKYTEQGYDYTGYPITQPEDY